MKKTILIVCLLFSTLFLAAQSGTWVIRLNNKTILSTRKEDAVKNVKKINLADWKNSGKLEKNK